MKVILLQEIKGQGGEGDVVEVKRGYAVNYLFPKKMAIEASKGNLKQLELRKHNIAKREAERLDSADKIQAALTDKILVIGARVGEEGQLFGSVTTQQIAEKLGEELGLEIDRRKIDLHAPIKTAGEHSVTVTVYRDIKAALTINVVSETELINEEAQKVVTDEVAADVDAVEEDAAIEDAAATEGDAVDEDAAATEGDAVDEAVDAEDVISEVDVDQSDVLEEAAIDETVVAETSEQADDTLANEASDNADADKAVLAVEQLDEAEATADAVEETEQPKEQAEEQLEELLEEAEATADIVEADEEAEATADIVETDVEAEDNEAVASNDNDVDEELEQ